MAGTVHLIYTAIIVKKIYESTVVYFFQLWKKYIYKYAYFYSISFGLDVLVLSPKLKDPNMNHDKSQIKQKEKVKKNTTISEIGTMDVV